MPSSREGGSGHSSMMRQTHGSRGLDNCARTLKQRRLALEPASPKRGPPSPSGLNAARVPRGARLHYGALRGDVAFEARAGARIEGRLVVELEGHVWLLIPVRVVVILRGGGGPVRCAVLPHCVESLCVWNTQASTRVCVDLYLYTLTSTCHLTAAMVCTIIFTPSGSGHIC